MVDAILESDVCRVCRCPATEEQPLFYPCLCSGSIKYVHQDCLVEWLKHSKKKYCELCKHSFSFSPIYQECMPKSLPFSVLAKGILKQIGSGALLVLRYSLVFFSWLFLLPYVTVQPFRYYFGWRTLWSFRYLVDPFIGMALIGVLLICVVGMMMLKEYMEQHRLFDFFDNLPVPEPEPEDAVFVSFTDDEDSPINPQDTGNAENHQPGSWLEQVTPREYRAFLRRREYHREKTERLRVRHHEAQSMRNAEILRMIDAGLSEVESVGQGWETTSDYTTVNGSITSFGAGPLTERTNAETFNPYNLDTNGGSMTDTIRAGSDFNEASTVARRPGTNNAGVIFRESLRCRICQKRSCINRDHVIQASAQQRAAAQQADPVLEAPPPPPQQAEPPRRNNFPLFDVLFVEGEAPEDERAVTLSEILGIQGSLFVASKYLFTVITAVTILVHASIILPMVLGTLIVDGTLPIGLTWLKSVLVFLILQVRQFMAATAAESELQISELLPFVKSLGVTISTALVLTWDCTLVGLLSYSPNWLYPTLSQLRPAAVRTFILTVKPLVLHDQQSYTPFLRLFAGFSATGLIDAACYYSILKHGKRPLGPAQRQLLSIFYLLGAFTKFVTITGFMFVIFPLYSGWLIDYFTLPLFKATLLGRLQFYHDHPLISSILHFIPGILFTGSLSYTVHSLRKVVRPGLLHFIRNPEDPDEHFVKETLEKPFMGQILGLGPTFVFYTWILSILVGGTVWFFNALFPTLAPLRLSLEDPMSSFSADVILQAIGKLVLDIINPYICKQYFGPFTRAILSQLRLSSYFLGGRFLPEESFPKGGKWRFVPDYDRPYKREKIKAMFKKEPQPMDIAKLVIKEGRSTAPQVDFSQISVPRRMGMRKSSLKKEENTKGFTVVFRPNYFILRTVLLFQSLFAYWLLSVLTFFVAPIMTGRYLASLCFDGPIRDSYTFIAGFIVFGTALRGTVELCKGIYASDPERLYRVFVVAPWTAAKVAIFSSFFFVIWPLMLGAYLMLALSSILSSVRSTRIIHMTEVWSFGVLWVKLLLRLKPPYIAQERYEAISKFKRDGMANIDLLPLMKNLLIPYTAKMFLALLEPAAYLIVAAALFKLPYETMLEYQSFAYSGCAFRPVLLLSVKWLLDYRRQLFTRVRDENYLIGNRLHNLEPAVPVLPVPPVAASPAKTAPTAPLYNGGLASPGSTYGANQSTRTANSFRPQPSNYTGASTNRAGGAPTSPY